MIRRQRVVHRGLWLGLLVYMCATLAVALLRRTESARVRNASSAESAP